MDVVRRTGLVSRIGILPADERLGSKPVAPPPPAADQVLGQAEATAKAGHKKILLVFSASWCGPVPHAGKVLRRHPQVRPVLEKSFVVVHLDGM